MPSASQCDSTFLDGWTRGGQLYNGNYFMLGTDLVTDAEPSVGLFGASVETDQKVTTLAGREAHQPVVNRSAGDADALADGAASSCGR